MSHAPSINNRLIIELVNSKIALHFEVSKLQRFKVFEIKVSKIPRFQDSQIPRLQDFKIPRFQENPKFQQQSSTFQIYKFQNLNFGERLGHIVSIQMSLSEILISKILLVEKVSWHFRVSCENVCMK